MRVFPVRGKGIGVHAKKIFARRRVIHRSCGEQTLRALLASVNNSGGTISLGVASGGFGVAVTRLGSSSPPLTPSRRAETAVGSELIQVSGSRRPTFAATS